MSNIMGRKRSWLVSTAMCAFMCSVGGVAQAQDNSDVVEAEEVDEVVVVGMRQAIRDAEFIKRNAESIVDSITATDIGAFPDKSIAEALQRVPGVTVARTASPTDITHYTAEPTAVIIRGLTQTRSEFNGRDAFSANSGYGLNFEDVSPALVSRVDTFKNQTADMVEGGIAGTVNIVTRLPFDQEDRLLTGTLNANYGDISKSIDPEFSGVFSDRWNTSIGEFGLLVSGTHSELTTTSRGAVEAKTLIFDAGTYSDMENYIPSGVFYTETEYERVRDGISLAGQWQSNDEKFLATVQFNGTKYGNVWRERLQENYWKFVPQGTPHTTTFNDPTFVLAPDPADVSGNASANSTPFAFQNNGMFGMGTINQTFGGAGDWGYGGVDWSVSPYVYLEGSTDGFGVFDNGVPQLLPCINDAVLHPGGPCPRAVEVLTKTRFADEKRSIEDLSFNFKWRPTEDLNFNFDYQHVEAETDVYDIVAGFRTFADVNLDLTGDLPVLSWSAPSYYNQVGADPFSDPRNYAMNNLMDHITESDGVLDAFRADGVYKANSPWIQEIRGGVRLAERTQEHKWSLYNWNTVSAAWNTVNGADSFQLTSGPTYNDDGTLRFQGYEPGYYEAVNFGQDILGGGLVGNTPLIFMNFDNLEDRDFIERNFSATGQTANGGTASAFWDPICNRADELPDSCFTQGEIVDVTETSKAAYAMATFGGDDAKLFDLPVTGNIGMRYVETKVESAGAVNYAIPFADASLDCPAAPTGPLTGAVLIACLNAASVDDQAFSSGGSDLSVVSTTHENWLPSFNMRLELTDNTYLRLAASRAISKPDIGLLKNYSVIQRTAILPGEITAGNPNVVFDAAGEAVSLKYDYSASTSNPRLKPIKADQFDISFEHYFEDVGSIGAVFFYKKFDDYIQNGTFVVPMTNNGVTRDVVTTGPVNGDGAKIHGFELQALKYFDKLPAPFDGFGLQGNYTYVKNRGVTNTNLNVDTTGEGAAAFSSQSGMINPGRLENMSDHTFNIVGLYEKGKVGARLAYNWRSKYVISVNDCCVGFPVWGEDEGFLDGSIRYALTDNIELSLQASNLLETRAKTKAQIKGPTNIDPNQEAVFVNAATFEYDRRFQFGVRAKF